MTMLTSLSEAAQQAYLSDADLVQLREWLSSDETDCPECAATGESERCVDENGEFDPEECETCDGSGYVPDPDSQEEIEAIDEIEENVQDWNYGATLINEDHFEDYAREFASDIGAIDDDARWPATCIDWEQAADELRMDYTSVEVDGQTFYVR